MLVTRAISHMGDKTLIVIDWLIDCCSMDDYWVSLRGRVHLPFCPCFGECLSMAAQTAGYTNLKSEQHCAIAELLHCTDTFVSLPPGYRKSLIKSSACLREGISTYSGANVWGCCFSKIWLISLSFQSKVVYVCAWQTLPLLVHHISGSADAAGCFQGTWLWHLHSFPLAKLFQHTIRSHWYKCPGKWLYNVWNRQ